MEFQPKSELKSVLTPEQKDYWAFLLERKKELEQKAIEKGYDKLTSQELLEMKEFVLMYKKFIKTKNLSGNYRELVYDNFLDLKKMNPYQMDLSQTEGGDSWEKLQRLKEKVYRRERLSLDDLRFIYSENRYYRQGPFSGELIKMEKDFTFAEALKVFELKENELVFGEGEITKETKVVLERDKFEKIEPTVDSEELKNLAKIDFLGANLTDVPKELKREIKYWRGDINDFSRDYFYDNLVRIGGTISLLDVKNLQSERLNYAGGIIASSAESCELDCLNYLGVCGLNVNKAKSISVPYLEVVGDFFDGRSAEALAADFLQVVHGNIFLQSLHDAYLPNLRWVDENINLGNANSVFLPKLEYLGGKIYLNKKLQQNNSKLVLPEEFIPKIIWV